MKVRIEANMANVLSLLGKIYKNAADAAKEYISNFIDSFLVNRDTIDICKVRCELTPRSITFTGNPPGMNQQEFKETLRRVADSIKREVEVKQIGILGIGIMAFQQFGRRAEFLSKKTSGDTTIKVILKEGEDEADFRTAGKKEGLSGPGMIVKITNLKTSPTAPRSSLSPKRLCQAFSAKFDSYLRKGLLEITISCQNEEYVVEPMEINLPRIAESYSTQHIGGDPNKRIDLLLWFEPAGKGVVSIRHMGVPIVDDISMLAAYGLEESVYAGGYVMGYIDADTLTPLTGRAGFEEDAEWIAFLKALDIIHPSVEAEVELLQNKLKQSKTSEVYKKAMELVQKLLSVKGLASLEWLRGGTKSKGKTTGTGTHPSQGRTGKRKSGADKAEKKGFRISIQEVPFEDGPAYHSRFVAAGGVVQINTLNSDFIQVISGPEKDQIYYVAAIIGKEVVNFNDKTGQSNEALERELTYHFAMQKEL